MKPFYIVILVFTGIIMVYLFYKYCLKEELRKREEERIERERLLFQKEMKEMDKKEKTYELKDNDIFEIMTNDERESYKK